MSGAQVTSLGKYAIRGVLGKGAMGVVYDGWDPVIDRRVAIKTVRLPDAQDEEAAEGLARFKREAQAAGRLTHPNIVGVFDYGETDDLAYIVMEFVEGRSLKDVLAANERLTTDATLKLMEDILAGLTFSHARGVVHRDIKPANIMITLDDRAKIADFGIARIEASSMTQAGTVLGTPAYMSPEQFMGQVVDRRTDIYSSGVLLYQLLTGDRPFDGSMTAIMHKVLTTVPPRPSELAVTAPTSLDAVVAKAMARRPEDRYDTAAEFAQALRAPALEEEFASDATVVSTPRPAAARPLPNAPSSAQEPPKSGSKWPIFAGGGVAVLAAAAAVAWFMMPARDGMAPPLQQASDVPRAPSPAVESARQAAASPAAGPSPSAPAAAPASQRPFSPAVPAQQVSTPTATTPSPAPAAVSPAAPAASPFLAVPPPSSSQPPAASQAMDVAPSAPPVGSVPLPSSTSSPAPSQRADVSIPPPASPFTATGSSPLPSSAPAPVPQQFASTSTPPPVDPAPSASNTATPAAPVRSPAVIEAALASSLSGVKCSLARATVGAGGTATVSGVVGEGQPAEALRSVVAASGATAAALEVQPFDGPYCPTLDLLRPLTDAAGRDHGGMELAQLGGPASLRDNDVIALRLTMPGFGGYLHVEYLQHDGTVAPQVPGPGYPSQTYAAHAQLELGTPRQDFEGWHVGPPFGTDMIVAVASTAPLFTRALPDSQPLAAYLASLQTAIEGLRRRGGSVAATAVVLDTRPAR